MKKTINSISEQFWLRKFSEPAADYQLPWHGTDRTLTKVTRQIPHETTTVVQKVTKGNEKSEFVYFAAALSICLSRYCNQQHVLLCTVADEELLPLQIPVDGQLTYQEHLKRTGGIYLEALGYADYAFEEFITKLNRRIGQDQSGAFKKVCFTTGQPPALLTSDFELVINLRNEGADTFLDVTYLDHLEHRAIFDGFMDAYLSLIGNTKDHLTTRLDQMQLLSEEQVYQVTEQFNEGFKTHPDTTFLQLFSKHVAARPDHTALIHRGQEVSYKKLDEQSNAVAARLLADGIAQEEVIAIMCAESPGMIVYLLGILKAGGCFLPLDPSYPEERIAYLISDSGAQKVVTTADLQHFFPQKHLILIDEEIEQATEASLPEVTHNDLAYIIYTSGTTGTPNGVMIEHGALSTLCCWHQRYYNLSPEDVSTKYAGFGFDASVWEIFPVLGSGAGLLIVENEHRTDLEALNEEYKKYGVTISFLPTQVGEQFSHLPNETLEKLLLGGDKVKNINEQAGYQIYNNYGPTENTVVTTAGLITKNERNISIGKPIESSRVYVLEEGSLRLQPMGVAGELCISGNALARGYVHNQELTDQKFVENPHLPGQKLYRTGDKVRWKPDGTVEFLGRIDQQVKVRGYRIELGEIEYHLINMPEITNVGVVLKKDSAGENSLCAFYAATVALDQQLIKERLAGQLPSYMIPPQLIQLDSIPVNANGKIDLKYLRDYQPERTLEKPVVLPANDRESVLLKAWKTVLGIETIGVEDNFFELGGDSIKGIQIQSRLLSDGYRLQTKSLFQYPTIRELAERIEVAEESALQGPVTGNVLLSPTQMEFFANAEIAHTHYSNQNVVLEFDRVLEKEEVESIFERLLDHHDVLRSAFTKDGDHISINQADAGIRPVIVVAGPDEDLSEVYQQTQQSLDMTADTVLKLVLSRTSTTSRLAIIAHHLVIDAASWQILLEDLHKLYLDPHAVLPAKTAAFKTYSHQLRQYAEGEQLLAQVPYWQMIASEANGLPVIQGEGHQTNDRQSLTILREMTDQLVGAAKNIYGAKVDDLLLAALSNAVKETFGHQKQIIWFNGDGRAGNVLGLDLSRTVGQFSSYFPLQLHSQSGGWDDHIVETKEALRKIPDHGIGYGVIQQLTDQEISVDKEQNSIVFNAFTTFDGNTISPVRLIHEGLSLPPAKSDENALVISTEVVDSELRISFEYSQQHYESGVVAALVENYQSALHALIDQSTHKNARLFTPSDFTYPALSRELIARLSELFDIEDIYQLSPAQEGMLFHNKLEQESNDYFAQISYEIEKPFREDLVVTAFEQLLARHDILRTSFYATDVSRPIQVVEKVSRSKVEFEDISQLDSSEQQQLLASFLVADKKNGFDLFNDALLRLKVFRLSESRSCLVWSFHHIIMDGWCLGILNREFYQLYQNGNSAGNLKLQTGKGYKHFISWLERKSIQDAKDYWANYLEGFSDLTYIQPNAQNEGGYRLETVVVELDRQHQTNMEALAQQNNTTVGTILECCWAIILSKYTHSRDVLFGKIVSGRPPEIDGVDSIVGLFINTIPLRVSVEDDVSFLTLLERVQARFLEGLAYQHLGISEVQRLSRLENNLFDHIFSFENYPLDGQLIIDNEALTLENIQTFEQTNFDFNVVAIPGDTVRIEFQFNANVYDSVFVENIGKSFKSVLESVVTAPDRNIGTCELVNNAEKEWLLHTVNQTEVPYPNHLSLQQIFEEYCRQSPDSLAAIDKNCQLTYAELDKRANQLAHALLDLGIQKGDYVAVCTGRTVEAFVSMMGILKSGAGYLTIDPDLPETRFRFIVEDSNAKCIVTETDYLEKVQKFGLQLLNLKGDLSNYPQDSPAIYNSASDIAYVCYTSGSTGQPKGVMIRHQGVARLVKNTNFIDFSPETRMWAVSSPSFDARTFEVWGALLNGGCLIISEKEVLLDAKSFGDFLQTYQINTMLLVTPLFNQLAQSAPHVFEPLEQLVVGGQALSPKYVNMVKAELPELKIINAYGPTENSVVSSFHLVDHIDGEIVPIGLPINNSKVYVLDNALKLLPKGARGELYVGGDGLAVGYLNDEVKTNQSFVENPYIPGEMIYATGDIVRWGLGDNLEYLGRRDNQVKIRGFRIELQEIENAISAFPAIEEVCVMVKKGDSRSEKLIAFFVSDEVITVGDLRNHIIDKLPIYMLPSSLIQVEALLKSKSGKTDEKALLSRYYKPQANKSLKQKTGSPTEERIKKVWEDVLGIEGINTDDNFFDLGGSSLDLMKVSDSLSRSFNLEGLTIQMFKYSTIDSLASYIDKNAGRREAVPEVVKSGKVTEKVKSNRAQQRKKRRASR